MLKCIRFLFIIFIFNVFAETNFVDPTTTPPGTPPDLSVAEQSASLSQIATDASGKYVYSVWASFDKTHIIIQAAISHDYGVSWSNPTTTPTGTPPNLSDTGVVADAPQIATDASGKYVYSVWAGFNGTDNIIQVAISQDYGISWSNPTTTPTGTPPDLSAHGRSAFSPQIATSGKYVYCVWYRSNGSNDIIQVAISQDYGVSWSDPTTTPTGIPPDLSAAGRSADSPQIASDASGKYVYCVWRRSDGTKTIIQVAISQDYGVSWSDPATTPTGTPPDLSVAGQNASFPKIAADASGKYVYCVWYRSDGANDIIQVAISQDYGVSWSDPTTTPTGTPPDLSALSQSAAAPQIATSGKYSYCVWERSDGTNQIIQVAISQDYGVSWSDPTTTPTGNPPNLTAPGLNALLPQITTDASGKYAYCVWYRSNETNTIIQVAVSQDYGASWSNPATTPTGSPPDLSVALGDAVEPQIATNANGKYVYSVWQRYNGTNNIIQVAIGITDIPTPIQLQLFGTQIKKSLLLQIDLINQISWNNISEAIKYRIYSDSNLTDLVGEVYSPELKFLVHGINYKSVKTYYITWVDSLGVESAPTQITIP